MEEGRSLSCQSDRSSLRFKRFTVQGYHAKPIETHDKYHFSSSNQTKEGIISEEEKLHKKNEILDRIYGRESKPEKFTDPIPSYSRGISLV